MATFMFLTSVETGVWLRGTLGYLVYKCTEFPYCLGFTFINQDCLIHKCSAFELEY